jgi:hypothetical protein
LRIEEGVGPFQVEGCRDQRMLCQVEGGGGGRGEGGAGRLRQERLRAWKGRLLLVEVLLGAKVKNCVRLNL